MGMKIEIDTALMAHSAWRKQFRDYLHGKASFDVSVVRDSHKCQFGIWLDNEGYRFVPSNLQESVRAAHDEFHKVAAGIVLKIAEKRFAEVRADIASDGALNRATETLVEVLSKVRLHEPTSIVKNGVDSSTKDGSPTG